MSKLYFIFVKRARYAQVARDSNLLLFNNDVGHAEGAKVLFAVGNFD